MTKYVLDQRMTRAHRLLADVGSAGRTLTAIAFDVGFSDLGFTTVEVVPRPGFWLEAAAALTLALAGIAFATQGADERQALRRRWTARRENNSQPSAAEQAPR